MRENMQSNLNQSAAKYATDTDTASYNTKNIDTPIQCFSPKKDFEGCFILFFSLSSIFVKAHLQFAYYFLQHSPYYFTIFPLKKGRELILFPKTKLSLKMLSNSGRYHTCHSIFRNTCHSTCHNSPYRTD